ncbi:MmpS family transport accessory protein [Micromonospora sp. CPCC 205711]|uniref:MmpS family transport accessory protein n=1 Tax=Micromonospora sp. CPCC 205547 TaxID=3122400 RepID=UPI002FF2023A
MVGIVVAVVAAVALAFCGCLGVGGALVGRHLPGPAVDDDTSYDADDPYYYEEEGEDPVPAWTPPTPSQPASPAASPSSSRGRYAVTYEVTGPGEANLQWYDANGEFIRQEGVRLPWRQRIRTDDLGRVMVIAANLTDGGTIRCSTTVTGRTPVTDAGEWQATCTGRSAS